MYGAQEHQGTTAFTYSLETFLGFSCKKIHIPPTIFQLLQSGLTGSCMTVIWCSHSEQSISITVSSKSRIIAYCNSIFRKASVLFQDKDGVERYVWHGPLPSLKNAMPVQLFHFSPTQSSTNRYVQDPPRSLVSYVCQSCHIFSRECKCGKL